MLSSQNLLNRLAARSLHRPSRRRVRRTCRARGPWMVERMEDRTLLSSATWAGDVSGDWDDPTKWSDGVVPGLADDVMIPFGDILVTHSASSADAVNGLNSQAAILLSAGTLTLH